MANKKISELLSLDTVGANLQLTVLPVLDTETGTTRKVTLQQLNDSIEANIPFAAAAFTQANNANINALTSGVYANAAFVRANNTLNVSTGGTVTGDLIINGNVSITGCTATLSVNTFRTADHIIDIGFGTSGAASQNAGVRVLRGDENPVQLRWNESSNKWQFTNDGTEYVDFSDVTSSQLSSAYNQANTANVNAISSGSYANASYSRANSANVLAQAAFDSANSRNYGDTNVALYLPTYTGNIAANIVKGGYTWEFGANGNLTVPASGTITAPNAQEFQLQAKDTNSLLRNEINLDPNNGTYMSVWSGELFTAFSTDDWDTASWQNNGGQGYAIITNAEDLANFLTTGIGSIVNSIEVSINGGARTPVQYFGDNDEQYDVELLVTAIPGSTTEITSLTFYYRTQSKIDIDYDNGVILLDGQGLSISLETTDDLDLRSGGELNIRSSGQDSVRIYTDNSTHMWDFNNTGSLTLPREGKIYGIGNGPAGDRGGYISWAGNTSGDGSGFNTMRLVPDLQGLEDADQYIILDPTSPGHIHIRAGGTQDNSQAILFFGGENSYVKVDSGPNPPVSIASSSNVWTFGTNGNLTFPDATVQSTAFTGSAIDQDARNSANAAYVAANTGVNIFNQDLNTSNNVTFNDIASSNLDVAGTTSLTQVDESFTSISDATGVVTHDCSTGQIFNHTSIDANFTANFTNLNLANGKATTITLVLNQGGTAYIPNAVQIQSSAQTIRWSANTVPTGNTNAVDVVSFSILNNSGTYIVLGQLSTFG